MTHVQSRRLPTPKKKGASESSGVGGGSSSGTQPLSPDEWPALPDDEEEEERDQDDGKFTDEPLGDKGPSASANAATTLRRFESGGNAADAKYSGSAAPRAGAREGAQAPMGVASASKQASESAPLIAGKEKKGGCCTIL